ncbi:MAG: DUF3306 domain-containing protein [Pseudomonadota bacterium]
MSRGDFWSRRKAAVEAEEAARSDAQSEEALAERSDEDILEELGLAEPETLQSAEDVREFIGSAVPQRLKTRALRTLWRLNPTLANLDGLVDYGEDFTDAATVVENLQTAYQVGKGMLAHIEALAEKAAREAEALNAPEPEPEPDADQVLASTAEPDAPASPMAVGAPSAEPSPNTAQAAYDAAYEDAPPLPVRRRMTFTFDATPA